MKNLDRKLVIDLLNNNIKDCEKHAKKAAKYKNYYDAAELLTWATAFDCILDEIKSGSCDEIEK